MSKQQTIFSTSTTIHSGTPLGPLNAPGEVDSLYVVGAVLRVLDLLPAVGQLWWENREGEGRCESFVILLRHHMDNWTHVMRRGALTGSFTACLPTPREQEDGFCFYVTMCSGLNTHCGGGRERSRKCRVVI